MYAGGYLFIRVLLYAGGYLFIRVLLYACSYLFIRVLFDFIDFLRMTFCLALFGLDLSYALIKIGGDGGGGGIKRPSPTFSRPKNAL